MASTTLALLSATSALLGALVGAALSGRNLHRNWMRDTRLHSYRDLVLAFDEAETTGSTLMAAVSVGATAVMEHPRSQNTQECIDDALRAHDAHRAALERYWQARGQMELVVDQGDLPPTPVRAGLAVATPWPDPAAPEVDAAEAHEAVSAWLDDAQFRRELRAHLVAKARVTLGVERRLSGRRKRRTSAGPDRDINR